MGMKVSKAIEILEDILAYVRPGDPPDEHDAVKLGIEALKREQNERLGNPQEAICLLPGETPEEEVNK